MNFKARMKFRFLNFDKNRYIQLLKKKSLLKQAFYKDNNDSAELREYSSLLSMELEWLRRHDFLDLLKKLMEEKSFIDDFCIQFIELSELNTKAVRFLESNLIILPIEEKALNFSHMIDEILDKCEACNEDENEEPQHIRNTLVNFIIPIFLRIENYLKDELI